jgi:hypothetical protein
MFRLLRRLLLALDPPPEEPAGLAWGAIYPTRPVPRSLARPAFYPVRSVPAVASGSIVIAPANPARRSLTIVNASTATLYLAHGPAASTVAYTVAVGPGATYILEEPSIYQGDLAGIWSAANGSAQVTEGF